MTRLRQGGPGTIRFRTSVKGARLFLQEQHASDVDDRRSWSGGCFRLEGERWAHCPRRLSGMHSERTEPELSIEPI